MEISHVKTGDAKASFKAKDGDKEIGRMDYTEAGNDKIIIEHTEVDEAHQGEGLGHDLLMEVVSYAREKGIKIVPLCPFAKSVFEKEPELNDVL